MGLHIIHVRLTKSLGDYHWVMINPCPKCNTNHALSAGRIENGNPDQYLGNRTLPCGMVANLAKKD